MKKSIVIIGLAIAVGSAPAGVAGPILNTLQLNEATDPGWSAELAGTFAASGGNTDQLRSEAGGRIGWRNQAYRLRLLASVAYQETDGRETERNITAHLRHNRNLGRRLSSVAFGQVQHNPFQRLQSRWLVGAGLRWDPVDRKRGRLALGLTPMLEVERLEGRPGHLARGRLSTFLIAAWNLREGIDLEGSGFYQPLLSDWSGSRAVGTLGLKIFLSGSLQLRTGAAIEHNSDPPVGVEKTDWSTYSGLTWTF